MINATPRGLDHTRIEPAEIPDWHHTRIEPVEIPSAGLDRFDQRERQLMLSTVVRMATIGCSAAQFSGTWGSPLFSLRGWGS